MPESNIVIRCDRCGAQAATPVDGDEATIHTRRALRRAMLRADLIRDGWVFDDGGIDVCGDCDKTTKRQVDEERGASDFEALLDRAVNALEALGLDVQLAASLASETAEFVVTRKASQ